MWVDDDRAAETVAMNPWTPGPPANQQPSWQSTGAVPRASNAQSSTAFPPCGLYRAPPRAWEPASAKPNRQQNSGWVQHINYQQAPNGWTMPQQQQPWSAHPAPSNSYADTAKKNMITPRAVVPQQSRMDSGSGWGGVKVDQHTPWDTGSQNAAAASASSVNQGPTGPPHPHMQEAKGNEWRDGTAQWGRQQQQAGPGWGATTGQEWHRSDGSAQWNSSAAATAPPPNTVHPHQQQQQQQTPNGWTMPQQQQHHQQQQQHHQEQNRLQYDPNPQTPGPWVPPQPTEMNNDMMWHDPNPKQKKIQRDSGTSVWGDPTTQVTNDIRRWKSTDDEELPAGANNPSVWDNTPADQKVSVQPTGWPDLPPTANLVTVPPSGTDKWATPQPTGWDTPTKGVPLNTPADVNKPNPDMFDPNKQSLNGHSQSAMNCLAEQMKRGNISTGGQTNVEGTNLQSLTQQIADQLRVAVNKNLINISILNQPLPQATLVLLNQLLQRVPKLEQANSELAQLRARGAPMNTTQQAEYDRLTSEVQTLQSEINTLQSQINANAGSVPSTLSQSHSTTPIETQSKLKTWKSGPSAEESKLSASASDTNLPNRVMSLLSGDGLWSAGKLDWSPPGSVGADLASSVEISKSMDESGSMPGPIEKSASMPTPAVRQLDSATPTPPVDDGPQEFIPGKKWEWRDPKSVAEDPNATPGNCKPNPLLSSSGGSFNSGSAFNMHAGNTTPTKLNEPRVGGLGGWTGPSFVGGGGDPWTNPPNPRNHPPSNLGQPFAAGPQRMGPFNRSIPSPRQSRDYLPYGNWILVQSNGQIDQQVYSVCTKIGNLSQSFVPSYSGIFCFKYADLLPDQAFIRLKQELGASVQIQLLRDSEVERTLKSLADQHFQQKEQQKQQKQQQQQMSSMMSHQHYTWQQPPDTAWNAPHSAGFQAPGLVHDSLGLPPPSTDPFMHSTGHPFPHDEGRPF